VKRRRHQRSSVLNRVDETETITLDNGVEMPALGLGVFQTPADAVRTPMCTCIPQARKASRAQGAPATICR
jgi:hypothetical protein